MACTFFSCGTRNTPIWNVDAGDARPRTHYIKDFFFATVFASPIKQPTVGPRQGVKTERVCGGQPRSLPISVKVCA